MDSVRQVAGSQLVPPSNNGITGRPCSASEPAPNFRVWAIKAKDFVIAIPMFEALRACGRVQGKMCLGKVWTSCFSFFPARRLFNLSSGAPHGPAGSESRGTQRSSLKNCELRKPFQAIDIPRVLCPLSRLGAPSGAARAMVALFDLKYLSMMVRADMVRKYGLAWRQPPRQADRKFWVT